MERRMSYEKEYNDVSSVPVGSFFVGFTRKELLTDKKTGMPVSCDECFVFYKNDADVMTLLDTNIPPTHRVTILGVQATETDRYLARERGYRHGVKIADGMIFFDYIVGLPASQAKNYVGA